MANVVPLSGSTGPVNPGVPIIVPAGPTMLNQLTDVSIPSTGPLNGLVLTYSDPNKTWSPQAIPMPPAVYISISITGLMQPGEVLMQYALPEAVTIPAGGAAGTAAISSIAAEGNVVCIVNQVINNITQQVGTVLWASGAVEGTVLLPNKINLISGDVLQLVAPAIPDSALANIGVTFACVRGG
jgi:hypothetical protein